MTINRGFFFDQVRATLFGGKLRPSQVTGLAAILDDWDAGHAAQDDRWLAYMLATAFHETATSLQPIREFGGKAWYIKMYDVTGARPALCRKNGNTAPGDGLKYYGKGYVQLTWKNNYQAMSAVTGVDLVANPDMALDPKVASQVMFHGMEHGSFTGRKLADYFNPTTANWVGARRIINGLDRADLIAGYGKAFYAALSHTT
jgi:putative chitinase